MLPDLAWNEVTGLVRREKNKYTLPPFSRLPPPAVAAAVSAPLSAGTSRKELAAWIRDLAGKDKDDLLVAAVSAPGERWRNELLHRFHHQNALVSSYGAIPRRTAEDLLTATRARTDERAWLLGIRRAADVARQKAKDEADRTQYLNHLAKREDAVWSQVAAHIQKRQPKEYDRAVILLTDLRDLAVRRGHESVFQSALAKLRKTHAAKDTFLRRLTKAKL